MRERYGAYATDDSNGPMIRPGDIFWMHPEREPAIDDMVRVTMADGTVLVGFVIDQSSTAVSIKAAAEKTPHVLARADIEAIDFVAAIQFSD